MENATCKKCKTLKPATEFFKSKDIKTGHDYTCKLCRKTQAKIKGRTREGVLQNLYYNQRINSKSRNHPYPNYTKLEFIAWGLNQSTFEDIYIAWVNSNFNLYARPSADRLDDYKPYTLDNLQLITWGENKLKFFNDMKAGKNRKATVAIYQYDLDGNFVKEFYSLTQASREGYGDINTIRQSAIKESKFGAKCQWRLYKRAKIPAIRYIYQFSKEGELLNRFNSLTEIQNLGFGLAGTIHNAAQKSRATKSGYIWSFNENLTHEQVVKELSKC